MLLEGLTRAIPLVHGEVVVVIPTKVQITFVFQKVFVSLTSFFFVAVLLAANGLLRIRNSSCPMKASFSSY